jgi:hypothetical protein
VALGIPWDDERERGFSGHGGSASPGGCGYAYVFMMMLVGVLREGEEGREREGSFLYYMIKHCCGELRNKKGVLSLDNVALVAFFSLVHLMLFFLRCRPHTWRPGQLTDIA